MSIINTSRKVTQLLLPSYFSSHISQTGRKVSIKTAEKCYQTFFKALKKTFSIQEDYLLVDGGEIYYFSYQEKNHPNRKTIFFIHGLGDTKETFLLCLPYLRKNFNIIAIDLPGFGKSFFHSHKTYDLNNYAHWVSLFIKKMRLENLILMGNSLGGAICLKLATENQAFIQEVVLVNNAGLFLPDANCLNNDFLNGSSPFTINDQESFQHLISKIFYKKPYIPYALELFFIHYFFQNNPLINKIIQDLTGIAPGNHIPLNQRSSYYEKGMNSSLKQIKKAVTIIWGTEDKFFPIEYAYLAHENIKESKLYLMPNSGHCPQIERPKQFCDLLKSHFQI